MTRDRAYRLAIGEFNAAGEAGRKAIDLAALQKTEESSSYAITSGVHFLNGIACVIFAMFGAEDARG